LSARKLAAYHFAGAGTPAACSKEPSFASHLNTNQQVPQPWEPFTVWHARCIFLAREAFAMSGKQSLNGLSDAQPQLSGKRSRSSILEIDSWMPSELQAISLWVDRLMRLIEESQSVPGAECDVELALREALRNAVVHGNQEHPETKVHIRCRCEPGNEISIVVTDQGKGFELEKIMGSGLASELAAGNGRGIRLMKAYMDDVHFEHGGSEVHMRKRLRTTWHS
jgi:serine/threonine-protein kinase RsbW